MAPRVRRAHADDDDRPSDLSGDDELPAGDGQAADQEDGNPASANDEDAEAFASRPPVDRRPQNPGALFRDARRLLDAADGDPSRLKDALLSFHGALEEYLRRWLAALPGLEPALRQLVMNRSEIKHFQLIALAAQYGGLPLSDAATLNTFSRIRNDCAHGARFTGTKEQLEIYARVVEAIVVGGRLRVPAPEPADAGAGQPWGAGGPAQDRSPRPPPRVNGDSPVGPPPGPSAGAARPTANAASPPAGPPRRDAGSFRPAPEPEREPEARRPNRRPPRRRPAPEGLSLLERIPDGLLETALLIILILIALVLVAELWGGAGI